MAYEKELEFAKTLALEAGEIMRKYFDLKTDATWKSDQTPLTVADTQINTLVIARVNEQFPGDAVLGEEESYESDSNRVWVCDPVDGTMPYSHGLPISTFSLALVVDGLPVVGVVYDPFMNRLFYATKGGGAFCNEQRIQVNSAGLKNALIDVEAFPAGALSVVPVRYGQVEAHLVELGAHYTKLWSFIIAAALVAAGKYTAVMFNIASPHDVAAAKILIEEAGGKTSDLFGQQQRYDRQTSGFIASNGVVHDELVALLSEVRQ